MLSTPDDPALRNLDPLSQSSQLRNLSANSHSYIATITSAFSQAPFLYSVSSDLSNLKITEIASALNHASRHMRPHPLPPF